jgi:hypothetical protein
MRLRFENTVAEIDAVEPMWNVGAAPIEAVWERLGELGIDDMAITTALTGIHLLPVRFMCLWPT